MSVEAITWALKVPVPSTTAKFVLVVLANQANAETGRTYPSIAYLAQATSQDRKTVVKNLQKLAQWKFIEDSGDRVGRTKQVVVYRLLQSATLFDVEPPQKRDALGAERVHKASTEPPQKRNSSKNGTVPVFPANSTTFPHETVPKTVHGTKSFNQEQNLHTHRASARAHDDEDEREHEQAPGWHAAIAAAVALRKIGMRDVHASRSELIALVDAGATIEQLTGTAMELTERKGRTPNLPYLASTLFGRAEDCQSLNPGGADVEAVGKPRVARCGARRESMHERAERRFRESCAGDG